MKCALFDFTKNCLYFLLLVFVASSLVWKSSRNCLKVPWWIKMWSVGLSRLKTSTIQEKDKFFFLRKISLIAVFSFLLLFNKLLDSSAIWFSKFSSILFKTEILIQTFGGKFLPAKIHQTQSPEMWEEYAIENIQFKQNCIFRDNFVD